ncbi:hypothetical protein [Aeromicrobium sp. UC242_57]|uniref:hypothetical protein n=1 Tax=Aeromicrobium sp. UC242_57 TaxID=3374624 RepID=UPI0037A60355
MTITRASFEGTAVAPALDQMSFGPLSLDQLRREVDAGHVDAIILITPDNHGRCLAERVPTSRFLHDHSKIGAFKVPLMLWGSTSSRTTATTSSTSAAWLPARPMCRSSPT